jgi:predicted metal-dependent hydrolase
VRLDGRLLRVCLPERRRHDANAVPNALIGWYINQAKCELIDKTRAWSSIIGVHPIAVTIRDPKTRWGSCSSAGRINYSWRVILAPPGVIDYLVVHELCHLLEPNHSVRYWNLVESFLPDYLHSRRWLKTNGNVLMSLLPLPSNK